MQAGQNLANQNENSTTQQNSIYSVSQLNLLLIIYFMLDRYRGQTFSGDRLAILGRLPRLSLQEERSMIKICYRGTLFDLVDGPKEILQLGSFPNIELTGMPHTDKSTIALSIDEQLTADGIPHHIISEQRPTFSWDDNPPAFNQALFHMTVSQLLNREFAHKDGPVLIDRGIYNPIPFMYMFAKLGMASEKDYEMMMEYIGTQFAGLEDGVIIMQAHADQIAERLEQNGRGLTLEQLHHLEDGFHALPKIVTELQGKYNYNAPLLIAEIDANQRLEAYRFQILPLVGSMCRILTKKNR